jgi:uncharacterized membrane protein
LEAWALLTHFARFASMIIVIFKKKRKIIIIIIKIEVLRSYEPSTPVGVNGPHILESKILKGVA